MVITINLSSKSESSEDEIDGFKITTTSIVPQNVSNVKRSKQKWYERRNSLIEFIKKYQRYPHHRENYDGFNIYRWMMCQFSFYERNILKDDKVLLWNEVITILPSSKIQAVITPNENSDDEDSSFEDSNKSLRRSSVQKKIYHKSDNYINYYSALWMKAKDTLVDFIKVHHRLPQSQETFNNNNIGRWVKNQKYRKNTLSNWQLKELYMIPEWTWYTNSSFYHLPQNKMALDFILN